MPFFLDVHRLGSATPEEVAEAHIADLEVEEKHGVRYLKYWFNQDKGTVFCLVEAPSAEAAEAVHHEAHGLVADRILQIDPEAAERYLGGGREGPHGLMLQPDTARPAPDGGFRTILFTDIEASTALTNQFGDERAMEMLRVHNAIVREALREFRGREIKHTGDGIMASFFSAHRAIQSAVRMQRALASHNEEDPGRPIRVRIGLSAGEPIEEHDDLFGAAVQLAARACAQAGGGEIIVSNVVAELCIGKNVPFEDRGTTELKGFAQPIRLHAVSWATVPTPVPSKP